MGRRGAIANSVEHRATTDRDDKGMPVHVVIEQPLLDLQDEAQVRLDLFATGHRQRRRCQLHCFRMVADVVGDLIEQRWPAC
jgi:hypothetical protein